MKNNMRKKSSQKINRSEIPKKFLLFKKRAKERLTNHYKVTASAYNKKVVNDIIFNEKTQVVANFKEYLIYDDNSEFLKR
jgi:hypothetical protein